MGDQVSYQHSDLRWYGLETHAKTLSFSGMGFQPVPSTPLADGSLRTELQLQVGLHTFTSTTLVVSLPKMSITFTAIL
jgi:hypothetical protein